MKKIKKWQTIIILLIGISGFWLSQNMWIFEAKVETKAYKEFISGTSWIPEKRDSFWTFNNDMSFEEKPIDSRPYQFVNASWQINESYLLEENEILGAAKWKILTLTNETMIIELISPSVGRKYFLKLKKYN